jgi:hypothetical protein
MGSIFWGHHGAFDRFLMRLWDWGDEQFERSWDVGFSGVLQRWARFSMAALVVLLPHPFANAPWLTLNLRSKSRNLRFSGGDNLKMQLTPSLGKPDDSSSFQRRLP